MEEKVLGKISSAEFGTISDYPFLFGLTLYFSFPNGGIGDGGKHILNMSDGCKWVSIDERNAAAWTIMKYTHGLLGKAKVNSINQLVGIPVEVIIKDNIFNSFRILTEVL